MKQRTRLLGVDYGTVRVGLAITDEMRIIASPLTTYERGSEHEDAEFFRRLVEREEVGRLVVGLPVHMSGDEGGKAAEARRFGAWLANVTGLPVSYWDERFTTVDAEAHLRSAGLSSQRRKARRDRVAAQILLQAYLEAGCPE
ncbi:MAG TPA: Holliday junction resolvase RuvX [Gemmataceae bacterium]|nr:Holliday junction resolvase RuvX [Gemmataceae bacterium]